MGSAGADSIVALDSNDNVLAADSNDIVDLGDGQDSVNFTTDPDGATVYGRGGNDSLVFTVAFNTLPLTAVKVMTPFGCLAVILKLSTATKAMTALRSRRLSPTELSTAATLLLPPLQTAMTL